MTQNKLRYAYSRLGGNTRNQVLLYIKEGSTDINLKDLDALIKLLDNAFSDPNEEATYLRLLRNLRQKDKSFSLYLAKFRRLTALLNYNDKVKRYTLTTGISSKLYNEIVYYNKPTEFKALTKLLLKLNNRIKTR